MALPSIEAIQSWLKSYGLLLLLIAVLVALCLGLVPDLTKRELNEWRALSAAFVFGALVGLAEIASRYRDEPIAAVGSPYGLVYVFLNGYISAMAYLFIQRFPTTFGTVASDKFVASLAAGFGAMAVMRSRIAVIKTPDGKEESIGPDYVLRIILRTIDLKIDRVRAGRRQELLTQNLDKIKALGNFQTGSKYLLASLLAFQNLDETQKKTLGDTYNDYQAQENVPEAIKQLALGFIFLTLVGETHFATVLENAKNLTAKSQEPSVVAAVGSISSPVTLPTPQPPPDLT
ncbi:MAG: hypothetical protein JWM21_1269 [Acidobacteria bacterium]|nr:hypothetical protein [Acidobacteriota bacterium]